MVVEDLIALLVPSTTYSVVLKIIEFRRMAKDSISEKSFMIRVSSCTD